MQQCADRNRILYICAPLSAPPEASGKEAERIERENKERAWALALEGWKKGWLVICPHLNVLSAGEATIGRASYEDFIELCFLMLRGLRPALRVAEDFFRSKGSAREVRMAGRLGLRVYYCPDVLPEAPAPDLVMVNLEKMQFPALFISDLMAGVQISPYLPPNIPNISLFRKG